MKKILTIILFIAACSFRQDAKVYICDSPTAYAYHRVKDCRGLEDCTHPIVGITKADAVNKYHRKKCHVCWH